MFSVFPPLEASLNSTVDAGLLGERSEPEGNKPPLERCRMTRNRCYLSHSVLIIANLSLTLASPSNEIRILEVYRSNNGNRVNMVLVQNLHGESV